MSDGQTHWVGCYEEHHRCCVANYEQSLVEIEQLRSAIEQWETEETEWKKTESRLLAQMEELEKDAEFYVKARQAQPTIHPHVDGGWVWSNCPECGPDVVTDEDGCCRSCGRDAVCFGKSGGNDD